jgi:hypothetical protein
MPFSGLFGLSGNPNQIGQLNPIAGALMSQLSSSQSQSNPFPQAQQPAATMQAGLSTSQLPQLQAPSSPSPSARIMPPAAPMSSGAGVGDHSFSTGYPAPNDAASIAALMARYGGTFRGAALPGGGGFRQP